jgi:cysteine-rich repeat protein
MREVDLMSRRIANLAFAAALGLTVTVGLSGVAQAGPATECGNSVVEPPEQCDDGNTTSGDGCSGISCLPEVCGDNVLNPDPAPGPEEECDDGNTTDDDGCTDTCKLDCGDGEIDAGAGETCDDSGESATCDDDCTAVECGDGVRNATAGEGCDDGNTTSGDGCSDQCQPETVAQTKPQQACINGINGNGLGVLKAQNKDNASCVKNDAAGKTDFATCFGTDVGGKVAKAEAKTTKTDGKKCTGDGAPTFAYTAPATVNGAAKDGSTDAAAAVLGAAPTIADKKADKAGAACQAEVLKRHNKLQETWLGEANKAKKTALKGSKTTPAVGNATDLAAAIDTAVAASTKITKAENGVNSGIAKKCPDAIVDGLFDCGGATTGNELALCVILQAKRGACLALEAADDLALACPGDV